MGSTSEMKVGIVQSSYIPWRGYFDMISDVDVFVFLDNVQFTKRDWRSRNQIKTSRGLKWLTVPVHYSRRSGPQLISHVLIDYEQSWVHKHLEAIRHAYAKAEYFEPYFSDFATILQSRPAGISELNQKLTQWVMEVLGIQTRLLDATSLECSGTQGDRLLSILGQVGATSYLSGPAAKSYLEADKFRDANIELLFKSYEYDCYPQLWGDFVGNVSILDLLFNHGSEAGKYL